MKHLSAVLTSSAILAVLMVSPIAVYAYGPGGFDGSPAPASPTAATPGILMEPDIFYGNTAQASCPTIMTAYDPATDTTASFPLTSTSTNGGFCNGRGMAWDGAHLWYTVVGGGFVGEGHIHEVGTTGGADITTMPDPYGVGGRGIGAMKFDAPLPGGHLWIESYLPVGGMVEVSELAVPSGAVLASCELPFAGGGAGSDTFSLFSGNEFATDGGEILFTLFFYHLPTAGSFGTSCAPAGAGVSIAGATGLNFASNGDCIYTNAGGTTFNGAGTCALPSKATTTNGFPVETEDITCTTLPATGSLCLLANPIPPTIFTTLSLTSIAAGGAVNDVATLSNLKAPTGTVTFFVSSTNTCPNLGATQVGVPVTVAGNGLYTSASKTFPTAGTFYWYAVYSGDAANAGLVSACEPLTVTPPHIGAPEFGTSAIVVSAIAVLALAVFRVARKQQVPTLSI